MYIQCLVNGVINYSFCVLVLMMTLHETTKSYGIQNTIEKKTFLLYSCVLINLIYKSVLIVGVYRDKYVITILQ